jgi:peroxiredoxin
MRLRTHLLALLALLMVSIPILSGCAIGTAAGVASPNNPAPDFTAYDLQGNPVTLSSLKGKVVLVNFWASWCQYCRAEMPDLEKFSEKYRASGVEVVGLDVGEDSFTIYNFAQQNGLSFRLWRDPDENIAKAYGVSGYPTTFFIDKQGVVRHIEVGQMSFATMEKNLQDLVGK